METRSSNARICLHFRSMIEKRQLLRGLACVLVMGVVGLVIGCGGGDSTAGETSLPSTPLTKQQFLKRANATCLKNLEEKDAALQKAFSNHQGAPSEKQLESLAIKAVIPAYNNLVEELGQLSPPSGDANEIEGILADYDTELKQVEDNPREFIQSEPFKDANEAAKAYGLETCSL
jgi:hypothetical protein